VEIVARIDGGVDEAFFSLPIVSAQDEKVTVTAEGVEVVRPEAVVRVSSSRPTRPADPGRVFNHVPGLQALPLRIDLRPGEDVVCRIRI